MRPAYLAVFVALAVNTPAIANDEQKAIAQAKLLEAAMFCARYASYSKKPTQAILEKIAMAAARDFDKVAQTTKSTEFWGQVVVNVSAAWSGPSFDFRLGRLYQLVLTDVIDRLLKHEQGYEHASERYRASNCDVIASQANPR